jgi:disulfide bond formation protein DsbB
MQREQHLSGTTLSERDRASVALPMPRLVQLAWIQALVATCGSLYFSEVLKLTPCVLCWYQRIAMYPLVVVLGVGLLLRERRIRLYALPLSLIGLAIAIYHNLLYYGIIPESIQPCTTGVSCTTRQIEWLGFITIPLLSLVAFTVISAALIAYVSEESEVEG